MQHRERKGKHEKELKETEESKKVWITIRLVMPKERRKEKKALSGEEVDFSNP